MNGCVLAQDDAANANRLGSEVFEVNFATPVTTVVALNMQSGEFSGAETFASLMGGGATCVGPDGPGVPVSPCFHITGNVGTGGFIGNLTISAPDITSVLIGPLGGSDTPSFATGVQFGVPEPGTFALLAAGLLGIGFARRKLTG